MSLIHTLYPPDPPDPNASDNELMSTMIDMLYRDQESAYNIDTLNNSLNLQCNRERLTYLDTLLAESPFIDKKPTGVLKLTSLAIKELYTKKTYLKYLAANIDHKTFLHYCDVLGNWLVRGRKVGATYPLNEIEEFWNSTHLNYDVSEIIAYLNSEGYIVSYIGPFHGPNQKLINYLRESTFESKVTNVIKTIPVPSNFHIQNISGNNNNATGQESNNKIKSKNDRPKSITREILIGIFITVAGGLILYFILKK